MENASTNTPNAPHSQNTPEARFKAGPVSATVWRNANIDNGKQYEFYTVSIGRNYKDKSGNWQTTNTLRMNDLPKASLVLNKAYEYITMRGEDATSQNS